MTPIRSFLLSALLMAPMAFAQTPIDSIVAVVDEDVVLRSELDRALGRVLAQLAQNNRPMPSRDALERQVLDQLIMVKLQTQRAEATGIRISEEEIDQGISRVAAQAGITPEQMRLTVTADGLDWGLFRQSMREEIMIQRMHQGIANSRVNITESEVDIFLANTEASSGEYRLGHILVGIPEGATPDQVQAARDKAMQVFAEINGGMDFTTAAITYSDGQQALQGGDLGWRAVDEMPEMFASVVVGLPEGQVSRPVRSASGFHLVKVLGHREQTPRMVEEYSARHIMIEISELVDGTEALELVNDVHQRILDGEPFEDLARQYSDDTSSANLGGDMGWFQPNAFGDRVRQVLDSLQDGEVSQPFQTVAGWHILQKIGAREQDRTEDLIRAQARDKLHQRKAQEEVELFLRQMRDEAFVEYRI